MMEDANENDPQGAGRSGFDLPTVEDNKQTITRWEIATVREELPMLQMEVVEEGAGVERRRILLAARGPTVELAAQGIDYLLRRLPETQQSSKVDRQQPPGHG